MNIEDTISTLRAMNADGVNYVGHAADVMENMKNRLDAYASGVPSDIARSMIKTADQLRHELDGIEGKANAAGKLEAAQLILALWNEPWPISRMSFIDRLEAYVNELK